MGPPPVNSSNHAPSPPVIAGPSSRGGAPTSSTNSAAQTPHLSDLPQQQTQAKKQRPRNTAKIYEMHARQRRMQQEYANHKNPPSIESLWICAFCEYEAVYGTPPRAFIQRYELKDYKEAQRKAERRRLLEKAKIKGRKSKKAAKQAHKNLAHQAAEFQKNEMLRHTKELQNHRTQLQQAHRDLQAHNAQVVAGMQQDYLQRPGIDQDQLYDDDMEYEEGEYDDEEDEEEEEDDDDDDDEGDTEELDEYLEGDPGRPPPLPPQSMREGTAVRMGSGR